MLKNYMKEGQKLPLFGVGPYIVYGMAMVNLIGMVHLYSSEVQKRVIENGLTTADEIKRRSTLFKCICLTEILGKSTMKPKLLTFFL